MSGHSKWHSIRHKKGATDAARGKVFTRHANLITIAARQGGNDLEMNPALRLAVDKAKADNMPNTNIERAIKRGIGEDKDGVQVMEIQYEGYGPEGIAIIVNTLTDNKNRTVASVRSLFSKNGGNLGETGCVGWMFQKKGIFSVQVPLERKNDLELAVIDAGAEDVREEGNTLEITTKANDFFVMKAALEKTGGNIVHSEITMLPQSTVTINDVDTARRIIQLIEALEKDEDVSSVAANFDIPSAVLEKIS